MTTPTKAEFLAAKVGSTFKFDGHFRKIVSLSPFRANDTGGGLTAGCEYRSIEKYWKFLSDLITDLQPPEPEQAPEPTKTVDARIAELEAENTRLRTMMREAVEEDRKTRREFTDGYFGKKYKSGLSVWAAKMEQALKGTV